MANRIDNRLTNTLLERMDAASPLITERFGEEFSALPIDRRIPILIQVVNAQSNILTKSRIKVVIDMVSKVGPWIVAILALLSR